MSNRDDVLKDLVKLRGMKLPYTKIKQDLDDKYQQDFTILQLRKMYSRYMKSLSKKDVHITETRNGVMSDTVIAMQENDDKDDWFVLEAHGLDPTKWEITSMTNNYWQQNNTEQGLVNLYQSKIKVKPITTVEYDIYTREIQSVRVKRNKSGTRNLVIPLADMHFPINTIETLEQYIRDVREVIENGYETIVVEMLGDMFHSNAMRKTQTIRGTELESVDMEFAIEEARRFFDKLLVLCLQNANNVRVEFAAGNHSDFDYMFMLYLEAKYTQVEVNRHNRPRIAYQLGNVGIMLTHGHFGKKADYPMLFATEFKDVWASSSWLEVHQGHKHTMEAQNVQGVIHRQLGVLKANDVYEQDNGYTMNYKSTQAFEYDDDKLRVVYELG